MISARSFKACSRLSTLPLRQHCTKVQPAHCRRFSTVHFLSKKHDQLPPRPSVDPAETHKKYLKGSGPGGQKINKTNSAVQLMHLPTGLVVKSQATRSRSQNETIARRVLAEKLEFMEKGAESRVALKGARKAKKKASADKKKRRKYRLLEKDKGDAPDNHDGIDVEQDMNTTGKDPSRDASC